MENGFALGGRIVTVDLSKRQIESVPTAPFAERFMGGQGISLARLLEEVPPETSSLAPENIIAFGAGRLVGTIAPGAARTCIVSKNVLTGGLGSANAGGYFAAEMKYAGVDNLIVTGKAAGPVFIFIDDGRVSLEDASFLWGQTTWETERLIREKIGGRPVEILSIGPAGEHMAASANVIVSRSRSASRCGVGAIMGSKHLKAVVARGSGTIEVADPQAFMAACREMTRRIKRSPVVEKLAEFGTPISFKAWNDLSALPTRNFQLTQMDPAVAQNLYAPTLKTEHIVRRFSCSACPVACSQFQRIGKGRYRGMRGEKIECQNLWDFGTKLGMDNLSGILKASSVCTQLGLDIDNASGAISWAIECFERGLLSEADTDGLTLRWGDEAVILALLEKIAHREGFGNLLARGSVAAAATLGRGSEKYAVHIKGQELAEELRAFKGWALGVSVAPRGGAHTMGAPLTERMQISPEQSQALFGVPTAAQPDTYEGKARLVVYYERLCAALEALGACFFVSTWMAPDLLGPGDFTTLFNLATGSRLEESGFMAMGERLHTLSRLFNLRHAGFGRKDDFPPARLFDEPTTGTRPGLRLDREKYGHMLDEYYELHGWSKNDGRPRPDTLTALGLDDMIG